MRIAYLGNFEPPHSTENHVARSLESMGHEVDRMQEGVLRALDAPAMARDSDLFLWTQTQSLAEQGGSLDDRREMLRRMPVPTAGFHLDRWWGLGREHLVREEPFFRVDRLFTADGGHDEQWEDLGVSHYWLPPGVVHDECVDAEPSHKELDVIFVGAWRDYGHPEWWPTRREMLEQLRRRYGRRFTCWPQGPAIRGLELNRLLASAKVVVGDSCLAGSAERYWSDRVPETTGRGGFLIHPEVKGLSGQHPSVATWELGDLDQLYALIDYYLAFPRERERARAHQAHETRTRHTYMDRMQRLLSEMR